MSKSARQFKKLKDREKQSKERVLRKRAAKRESEALEKELADLINKTADKEDLDTSI